MIVTSTRSRGSEKFLQDRVISHPMKFAQAFKESVFRYSLSGVKLAQDSGLTPGQVSKFRNGGELRTDSLEKLLEAMPLEAREYMMSLVLSHDHDHVPLPKETIETVQQ